MKRYLEQKKKIPSCQISYDTITINHETYKQKSLARRQTDSGLRNLEKQGRDNLPGGKRWTQSGIGEDDPLVTHEERQVI